MQVENARNQKKIKILREQKKRKESKNMNYFLLVI